MRYALLFALAVVAMTVVAIATFDRISASTLAAPTVLPAPVADTVPTAGVTTPAVPTAADYARYAEADRSWRERYARPYTIAELRARGNGKRTPREAMQDRVYGLTRRGDPQRAIAELDAWVRGHPRDRASLLALARLLNEAGRQSESITRYRQLLALQRGQD